MEDSWLMFTQMPLTMTIEKTGTIMEAQPQSQRNGRKEFNICRNDCAYPHHFPKIGEAHHLNLNKRYKISKLAS